MMSRNITISIFCLFISLERISDNIYSFPLTDTTDVYIFLFLYQKCVLLLVGTIIQVSLNKLYNTTNVTNSTRLSCSLIGVRLI